jgi:tetratricopeptide (TPR) repeat protein
VLALLALALVLRLVTLHQAARSPYYADPILDGFVYDVWGQRLARGEWAEAHVFHKGAHKVLYQDPLYPWFLAATYTFGRHVTFTRLVQIAIGLGSCLLIYAIGRRLFGRGVATLALATAAGYKAFLFYDTLLLKTFLEVFFLLLGTWGLLVAQDRDVRDAPGRAWRRRAVWFGAGLALGVGALARGNILLLVPALLLWLRTAFPADGWRGAAKRWAWIAGGALLGISPATAFNLFVGGEFVLTTAQAGPNFVTGNHPGNPSGRYNPPPFVYGNPLAESHDWRAEAERRLGRTLSAGEVDRYWLTEGARYVWNEPGTFLEGMARKFVLFWHAYEYPDQEDMELMSRPDFMPVLGWPLPAYAIVSPLGLLGIFIALGDWRRRLLPLLVVAVYAGSVMLFYLFARYRLAAVPFLILFASYGIVWAWRKILEGAAEWAAAAVAGGIALFVGTSVVGVTFGDMEAWGFGTFRSTVGLYNLGEYHLNKGRYDEARAEFLRALDLRPDWGRAPEIHVKLAQLALHRAQAAEAAGGAAAREARLKEARHHIDLALRRAPDHAAAHRALGNWAFVTGDDAAAVAALEKAAALQPGSSDARINLAEVHLAKGRTGAAEAALRPALERDPCDAPALHLLGRVAETMEDFDAAFRCWQQAVLCDPLHLDSRRALMRLHRRHAERFAARRDTAAANAALQAAVLQAEAIARLRPGDPEARALLEPFHRALNRGNQGHPRK